MYYYSLFTIAIIVLFLLVSVAPLAAEDSAVYQWQMKRLMQPDDQALSKEQEDQSIFIYENLRLADVEKALDEHFARMENMMFIRTLLPPTAAGGEPEREQDGCD